MPYNPENIFAKILRGEIPNNTVYEDDNILAFHDASPAAPVHVLVVPKSGFTSFDDFAATAPGGGLSVFFRTVRHIAADVLGLQEGGYRLITNHGNDANQTVPHFHIHILGGAPLGGLLADDVLAR